MTLTKNPFYQGQDRPYEHIVPPHLNKFQDIRKISVRADTTGFYAGLLCYLTGGTQANDMSLCPANFGDTSQEGILCVVDTVIHNPNFAVTSEKPIHPDLIPNTDVSGSIADYTYAEEGTIIVIPLHINMFVWLLGSVDATFDTTFGYEYECAASGLIAAPGDPDGAAIDMVSQKFKSWATTLNQNWALMQYVGKHAHDKTA